MKIFSCESIFNKHAEMYIYILKIDKNVPDIRIYLTYLLINDYHTRLVLHSEYKKSVQESGIELRFADYNMHFYTY